MEQTKNPIIVYTDGSSLTGLAKWGGWAVVLIQDGVATELWGRASGTTSNRMELTAAVQALRALPEGSNVYLHTDSQYLQKGISLWMPAWKRRNWQTSANKPVANKDLWILLDIESNRHIVSWHWVKGHDGDVNNERCDMLAYLAACNRLPESKGVVS